MWVSPVSQSLLDKYNLIQKKCTSNKKIYKDVLIFRKGYVFTDLDRQFIEDLNRAKLGLSCANDKGRLDRRPFLRCGLVFKIVLNQPGVVVC